VLLRVLRSPGAFSADIGFYGALAPVAEPLRSVLERPAALTSMTWACAGPTAILHVVVARPTPSGADYFFSRTFVRRDGTVVTEPLTPRSASDAAYLTGGE